MTLPLWLVVLWLAVSVALLVGCISWRREWFRMLDKYHKSECESEGWAATIDIQQKQLARQQELLDRLRFANDELSVTLESERKDLQALKSKLRELGEGT